MLVLVAAASVSLGYMNRSNTRSASLTGSPDVGGKITYARAGSLWIYTAGGTQQITAGPKDAKDKRDAQPSFSPDGSHILYTRFDEGFSDLYEIALSDPSVPQALTNHRPKVETGAEGYNTQALWAMQGAWSPDGQALAFTSDVGTEYPALFTMNADGTGGRRMETLNHGIQAVEHPAWSPNGDKIAVANYVTDNFKGQIWVLNLSTSKWIEITAAQDGAYDPAWSPDGAWIAFTMRQGNTNNIFVAPTDTQSWTDSHAPTKQLTTDGASRQPTWSPDGTKLAYISFKDASFDLYAGDLKQDTAGKPALQNIQKLTDKANLDAASGLSWSK
ncbi:MAG: LpqB family beta-propeller domain-containing protein [Chloroflexota bacterium]|nr:LpqB family beta-propeller domain-containing protein [Chloroflexota bacterium]